MTLVAPESIPAQTRRYFTSWTIYISLKENAFSWNIINILQTLNTSIAQLTFKTLCRIRNCVSLASSSLRDLRTYNQYRCFHPCFRIALCEAVGTIFSEYAGWFGCACSPRPHILNSRTFPVRLSLKKFPLQKLFAVVAICQTLWKYFSHAGYNQPAFGGEWVAYLLGATGDIVSQVSLLWWSKELSRPSVHH